jgi:hypothetical protein
MIVHFHPSVPARNFSPLFKRETAPAPFFKYGGANHPIGGRIWRPAGKFRAPSDDCRMALTATGSLIS